MPPGEEHAFTVLRPHDARINVVKPLQCEHAAPPAAPAPAARSILDPKFSRALDLRLRRLKQKESLAASVRRPARPRADRMTRSQPRLDLAAADDDAREKTDRSPTVGRQSRARGPPESEKPRFVTTVKTGQFLLPPPEVASLLGLDTLYPQPQRDNIVYSYASKPKAVAPRARCAASESPRRGSKCPVNAARAFGGVRALVAGVAGMAHMLDKQTSGSSAQPAAYSNVMHDKRVVRGSTFTSHPMAAGDGVESAAARAARTRRRALARRAAAARLRPGTPPPAPGRRHYPIQTEYYLEELFDKGVELEVGVQTDLFIDRPATPVYVPAKTGADAFTQIYPGDLFDFDLEVQPILEVLVGKTAEQALAEVAQEEELATLREQQRRYCELRDAERGERARLAAQDARLHAERARRVASARAGSQAAREARERTAAATLVHGYLADLLPAVLAGLRDQGYLVERLRRGVDDEFMPWLVEEVTREMECIITSRDVITEIVRDVVEARAELYRAEGERLAAFEAPPDSITPPSEPEYEVEERIE